MPMDEIAFLLTLTICTLCKEEAVEKLDISEPLRAKILSQQEVGGVCLDRTGWSIHMPGSLRVQM